MRAKLRGPEAPKQLVTVITLYRKTQQRFELIKAYWNHRRFYDLIFQIHVLGYPKSLRYFQGRR